MKRKQLTILPALLLCLQLLQAQSQGYCFSPITCAPRDAGENRFLMDNELKIWKAAVNGKVAMYDNAATDIEFRVRMTTDQVKACFQDSFPYRSNSYYYGMILMENRAADTCYIMSYSPEYYSYQSEWNRSWPWTENQSVRYLTPLSDYSKILPAVDMVRLHSICAAQLASVLGGQLSGDTISRKLLLSCWSDELLPQAPYINLGEALKNGMLSGNIRAFDSQELQHQIRKKDFENVLFSWDSTYQLEDPNNPGTFILAPKKSDGQPSLLFLYEKWIPFPIKKGKGTETQPVEPYAGYRREITAYGVGIQYGSNIWFDGKEAAAFLKKTHFNMVPYEESFRAERYNTLQIRIY